MEYIGSVIDNDIFGNGIVKKDNVVIFIKGAVKGDKIRYKIVSKEKRYWIGVVLEVVDSSSFRKNVFCSYYDKCGGCSLMHINNLCEDNIKYNYIKNIFKDFCVKSIVSNDDLFYRNKITLHVNDGKLGYYNEKSNDFVEIRECLLASDNINETIKEISKLDLSFVKSVMVRFSYTTSEIMVKFVGEVEASGLYDKVTSLYINDKKVYGKDCILEVIDGIKYTNYPDAFFQVNTKMMIKLYDIIKKYALVGNKLLDLYCGTGTIGIYLRNNYKNILGIEKNKSAIENANLNKSINKISNISFKCMDCKDIKEDYFDTVIVDPPRSGMNKDTIKFLNKMKSFKIVYVSCNPLTLRRDLKLLSINYDVKEISVVNMFRNTSHVECVALLQRKG